MLQGPRRIFFLASSLCALIFGATPALAKPRSFCGGVALSLHSKDPRFSYAGMIKEIRDLGATDISILVHFYQENAASPRPTRHPLKTPSDRVLLDTIRAARKLGLRVMVMPILLLDKPKPEDWRGNLKPPDWGAWWSAYQEEMLDFARICERGGAQVFSVGSELSSTEERGREWVAFIRRVRQAFSGELTYSANWDHYDRIAFWNHLDFMGISGYYELTRSQDPKLPELVRSWGQVKERILSWRREQGVRSPLLFTEVGYASQDGCASKPWNYYHSTTVDLAEQALCFQAFIKAWDGEASLAGAYIYEWWGTGGPEDHQYTPRGKPAEKVLRAWFRRIRSKTETRPASKPDSRPASPPSGG